MINKKKIYGSLAIIGVTSMLSPIAAIAADGDTDNTSADTITVSDDNATSNTDDTSVDNNTTNDQDSTNLEDTDNTGTTDTGNQENTTDNTFTLPDGKSVVKLRTLNDEELKCIDQALTADRNTSLNGSTDTDIDDETETSTTETTTPEETTSEETSLEETTSEEPAPEDDGATVLSARDAANQYAAEDTTDDSSNEEPAPETNNVAENIKVDLTRPNTVGLVLNGMKMQDIQLVESTDAGNVTVKGLPEGLRYDETSGTITGIPNVEIGSDEDSKVFNLEIEGTDSPAIEKITVFKDTNGNGIADKDENDDSITLNFVLEDDTLYISSPTGTKIGEVSIDAEGYLVSAGERIKGSDGEEIRVIGEDGELVSTEITVPVSALFDANEDTGNSDETVVDEEVVVDLGCLAALMDNDSTTTTPEEPTPDPDTDTTEQVREDTDDQKEEPTEDKGNGSRVLNNGTNRDPSGYQNNSEKYTPTLEDLNAGGRLVSNSTEVGPKVDTGGYVETGLLVKLIQLVKDNA